MLRSYLKNGEKLLLFKSYSGEKYSKKDSIFFIIGILFGTIAAVSLIFSLVFSYTLLFPCIIAGLVSYGLIYYYLRLNKLHFTKNVNISIEYMLTNNRFLYVDLKNPSDILEIPFSDFNSSKTRINYALNNATALVIQLNGNSLSTHAHNDVIEISNQEIVLQDVSDSFLLHNAINFLIYLIQHNIDDINNTESFLDFDEHILYTENSQIKSLDTTWDSKIILLSKYGFFLFIVIFLVSYFIDFDIFSDFSFIFLAIWFLCFIKSYQNISFMKHKKKHNIFSSSSYHNLKYVITNKRVLFFDFDIPILYTFNLKDIDYVNINDYNKYTDTGDIYLSNTEYSKYIKKLVNSNRSNKSTNKFEYFFPLDYSLHRISDNFDVINCWKIKLYGVKNPHSVIDKFIVKHINNKNKNTK